jgi:DNA-binding MarR family transcriptional regulator
VPLSTATGVIERLVSKGFIERSRSESDRRIVVIRLTDDGKRLAEEIKGSLISYAGQVLNELTEEEKALLLKLVDKVVGIFSGRKTAEQDKKEIIVKKIEIE